MRLLIPIDGSSLSQAAVDFVASRSTLMASRPEIELLNVQYPIPSRAARVAGQELVREYHAAEAESVIEPALEALRAAGLKPTVTSVVGSPATEVVKRAQAVAADLIVMGSHGHTGFKKLLFGSVTGAVLASSTTPLLVLRDKLAADTDSLKVGIALDGSDYGIAAVNFLLRHRDLFGALPSVTLVHVVPDLLNLVDPSLFDNQPVTAAKRAQVEALHLAAFEKVMAPARERLASTGLRLSEVRLTGNNVGDEIAAWADKTELDVLVIGSHGDGALLSAMLGSVATRVATQCRNALLFIQQQ